MRFSRMIFASARSAPEHRPFCFGIARQVAATPMPWIATWRFDCDDEPRFATARAVLVSLRAVASITARTAAFLRSQIISIEPSTVIAQPSLRLEIE
jgi:hypothetical protein